MFKRSTHPASTGLKGVCAHCQATFALSNWQLNAIAIYEPFGCSRCSKALSVTCPRQMKRFKSLDSLAALRASMTILITSAMLIALVCEWVGLISVLEQLNFSLIAVALYFLTLCHVRKRQQMTLILQAVRPAGLARRCFMTS